MSRGFDLYRRDINTSSLNIGNYDTSSYGGGVRFGVPLAERDALNFGLAFDYTKIGLATSSPDRYINYCKASGGTASGCENTTLRIDLGWVHDTRDNVLFPNKGVLQRLTGEIGMPGLDQEYYKIEYKHTWYKDITKSLTLMLNGNVGYAGSYGDRPYPFFKNFYAGGVDSVRGFRTSSLGPKETDTATNQRYSSGGTRRVIGNAELFFPVPGLKDSKQFRLSAFVDAGTIWGGTDLAGAGASDNFRYSAGLGVSWYSPFGPIKLVFGHPLNKKKDDETRLLDFQMGTSF